MFGLTLLLNKILFHYQRFSFHQYLCYLLSSSFNMILRKNFTDVCSKSVLEPSEPQQNSKFSFNLFGLFSIAPLKGLPLLFLCFAFKQFIDWRCLSFHWLPENNCKSNHLLFMSSDLKSILSIYHFAV